MDAEVEDAAVAAIAPVLHNLIGVQLASLVKLVPWTRKIQRVFARCFLMHAAMSLIEDDEMHDGATCERMINEACRMAERLFDVLVAEVRIPTSEPGARS